MLDAEHYFDGYKANSQYALAALRAAAEAGVDAVVLCDTNGGSMPWQVEVSRQFRMVFMRDWAACGDICRIGSWDERKS
jgi:isopropylmalate/homocitrate/citramalate synthase